MAILPEDTVDRAVTRLEKHGFHISFGQHVWSRDATHSSSVQERLDDLHEAFADASVDGILTAIGGYNANQLLRGIDYGLLRRNPKVLCGFSDITVLSNAIFAQTGLVTYSGPHFSSWGMEHGFAYSEEYQLQCLSQSEPYILEPSPQWSDDPWFIDQEKRHFIANDGYVTVRKSKPATGTIIGGHIRCLAALQGTEYWPGLRDSILFLEEDEETSLPLFDRLVESISQQKDFGGVRGVVIGRFQENSNIHMQQVVDMFRSKPAYNDIPIVTNVDFGHTTPIITYPIGGVCALDVSDSKVIIEIKEH